ncbi:MAG TPA: DUF1232 domain-containing protein [Ignavibacteria bacterium]|nr:DUF1232 domain-containing protein [Ignavibacteria bacterium]
MGKEAIIKTFRKTIDGVDENKLGSVLNKEKSVMSRLRRLDPRVFVTLFRQIKLAMNLLKDYKTKKYRDISWTSVAVIVAGILYFLNPLDVIPDVLSVIGFTDDAIVLAFIFNSIKKEFDKYINWRGLNPEEYA